MIEYTTSSDDEMNLNTFLDQAPSHPTTLHHPVYEEYSSEDDPVAFDPTDNPLTESVLATAFEPDEVVGVGGLNRRAPVATIGEYSNFEVAKMLDILLSQPLTAEICQQFSDEVQSKLEQFVNMKEAARVNIEKLSDVIVLNVGGTTFSTSRDTLLKDHSSYFYSMFGSGYWRPNENGEYFIDRDPTHFRYILNYLRDGKWDISKLPKLHVEELLVEADYYNLREILDREGLNFNKSMEIIENTLQLASSADQMQRESLYDIYVEAYVNILTHVLPEDRVHFWVQIMDKALNLAEDKREEHGFETSREDPPWILLRGLQAVRRVAFAKGMYEKGRSSIRFWRRIKDLEGFLDDYASECT
eukprot:TRINITY_DN9427_c0_g1_i1.p1 TRINITY_DN9427_c0_g1~~TRINITY_DN9427_c0_g1_i1.p1  ORF type:complete len:359 (+),score=77.66 TRINITY_DN9427_c0_g1_i1:41-1117(+)